MDYSTAANGELMQRRCFRWWHAVVIFLVANGISALPAGLLGNEVFYNSFQQSRFAPPSWLFAPMWLFLNVTSLVALYWVANHPVSSGRRRLFLVFEASGWVLFASFTTVYFGLKSPILGAGVTVASLAVALGSFSAGLGVDRRAAALIFLRVLWLALASYISLYTAGHNTDPFLFGAVNPFTAEVPLPV